SSTKRLLLFARYAILPPPNYLCFRILNGRPPISMNRYCQCIYRSRISIGRSNICQRLRPDDHLCTLLKLQMCFSLVSNSIKYIITHKVITGFVSRLYVPVSVRVSCAPVTSVLPHPWSAQ